MPRLWHGDHLLWEPRFLLRKDEDDEWDSGSLIPRSGNYNYVSISQNCVQCMSVCMSYSLIVLFGCLMHLHTPPFLPAKLSPSQTHIVHRPLIRPPWLRPPHQLGGPLGTMYELRKMNEAAALASKALLEVFLQARDKKSSGTVSYAAPTRGVSWSPHPCHPVGQ